MSLHVGGEALVCRAQRSLKIFLHAIGLSPSPSPSPSPTPTPEPCPSPSPSPEATPESSPSPSPSPTAEPCAFSDDFNRSDRSLLNDNGWVRLGTDSTADWRISDNEAVAFANIGEDYWQGAIVQEGWIACPDQSVEEKNTMGSDSWLMSCILRATRTTMASVTGYLGRSMWEVSNEFNLNRFSGTTLTQLASVPEAGGIGWDNTMKVTIVGSTLKLYKNGAEKLSTVDSTYGSGDCVGMAVYQGGEIDDFAAISL